MLTEDSKKEVLPDEHVQRGKVCASPQAAKT